MDFLSHKILSKIKENLKMEKNKQKNQKTVNQKYIQDYESGIWLNP